MPSRSLLLTFLIAMVPLLELRGAIPYGVLHGLTPLAALLIAIAGNLLPVPFLILFTRRVFAWLKTKGCVRQLIERLEIRAFKKSQVVNKYAGLGLFILVAIPLPGAGPCAGAGRLPRRPDGHAHQAGHARHCPGRPDGGLYYGGPQLWLCTSARIKTAVFCPLFTNFSHFSASFTV